MNAGEIETLLNEEICDEFKQLKGIEVGTDEYVKTVDGLAKLMDRALAIDKLNIEHEEKVKSREFENDLKKKQFEEQKKQIEAQKKQLESQIKSQETDINLKTKQMEEEQRDRMFRNWMTVAGIVLPSVITVWGTIKTIEFEKEGTITTIMGRGFINKLLPKK